MTDTRQEAARMDVRWIGLVSMPMGTVATAQVHALLAIARALLARHEDSDV